MIHENNVRRKNPIIFKYIRELLYFAFIVVHYEIKLRCQNRTKLTNCKDKTTDIYVFITLIRTTAEYNILHYFFFMIAFEMESTLNLIYFMVLVQNN